jgi:hypothetical protein
MVVPELSVGQYMLVNLALSFLIPILGLVIGIVGIKKRSTKKGKCIAIAGVASCSLVVVWDLFSFIAGLWAI